MEKQFNSLSKVNEFRLKLYPNNFTKVRNFYENILEFPVINEWDNGDHEKGIMFDTGTAILELLAPKLGYKEIQGADVSLEVQDLMGLWEYIKEKTDVVFEPRHNSWGDTSFRIRDPEGFKITFFKKDN
ncbi:MAG: VOC family protein [Patescibacteria group bacterium]